MRGRRAPRPDVEPVDHYGDGDWYDAEYVHIRADLDLYRAVAREATGPILELACGTGRLSFPMAEAGRRVTGVDASPAMLARARRRAGTASPEVRSRLDFVEGDMRSVRLGRRFDRVVLAFNGILHLLEDDELLAGLETARAHLAPGGRIHLDLFSPPTPPAERDPDDRFDPQPMVDPHTGERWLVTENNRYDPRRQLNHMFFYYRRADPQGRAFGPERRAEVVLRVLHPRELDAFVRWAGLAVAAEYEDYERTRPYTARTALRVLELVDADPARPTRVGRA